MSKRLFDFIFSISGLIILSPFLLLTGILIKFLMPGPIFFIQQRVGRNGKSFKLVKFRTMVSAVNKDKGSFDAGDKSRITALGKFLRKTKIDELPQLFNVLIGQMSLVGPRPEVKEWTEVYPEKWKIVLSVKPGITDNASIVYRNEEEILAEAANPVELYKNAILPEKLDLYIDYVNNHSIRGDLKIIYHTIAIVILQ